MQLEFVFLGLSITSSWGNGHATTYRGLVRELVKRGHDVLFLERDLPFYEKNRDLPQPGYGRTQLYSSLEELQARFGREIARADAVVVGSYVPDGTRVGDYVLGTAPGLKVFYDIDTPITVRALAEGAATYVAARQVGSYDLYLSFTGGPMLKRLELQFGARAVRVLHCSADLEGYHPEPAECRWALGYLGTYSADRQPSLERLLLEPARQVPGERFAVAGPQYPAGVAWPENVERRDHVPPPEHRSFYAAQRFTLNLTRHEMMLTGYSPSIRLFEAAACGVPIISDAWPGVEEFFTPGEEILVARTGADVVRYLTELPRDEAGAIGEAGRRRVCQEHTAAHRAEALEAYVIEALEARARGKSQVPRPSAGVQLGGAS